MTAGVPADQLMRFLAGGYVPQPRQLLFHAAARQCDLPNGPVEVGFGGARGPGKSHASLAQLGLDDCQRVPGLKALFLRNVGKAARESFEDLITRVLRGVPYDYRPTRSALTFPNGSRIYLGGFRTEGDIDSYLGIEYDAMVLEEVTLLSSAKYQKIGGSLRTSKPNWRPRMYVTTNPGGVGHAWFKSRFINPWRAQAEDGTRFVFAVVTDNCFVNQEYVRWLDQLTGWLKQAWRYGDWDVAAGQFFTTWRPDVHVRPAPDLDALWRKWGALDYGFTHYTVFHLLAEDSDGRVYVVDEHAERRWLPERHAAAIQALLARHDLTPAQLDGIYAGRDVFARQPDGGTVAGAYAAQGLELRVANDDRINGAAEVLRRLGDADAGLPARLFVDPACGRLIECLPSLEHDPHRPEDVAKVDVDDDGLGGDDAYDAARYGIMAACRDSGAAYIMRYA